MSTIIGGLYGQKLIVFDGQLEEKTDFIKIFTDLSGHR